MGNLDEFLTPPVVIEPAAEPEVIDPEPLPEPAAVVPPAPAAEPPDVAGLKQALMAERQKRQFYEAELAKVPEVEKPYLGEEYEQRFAETAAEFDAKLENQRITLSEEFAREKYPDYEDKFKVFAELAAENPALITQMRAQSNPAGFAYKTATNQLELAEMQNPEEYETKLRAKITAELKAASETEAAKREALPGSLATTRGVAGTQPAAFAGPTPVSDLFNR